MSFSTTSGNINKEILINQLKLKQERNTIFFENEKMVVLSPSIQNDSWWFDLLIGNIERVKRENKPGLLILRLGNDLLIADLRHFISKMVTDETVVHRQNGSDNWKFNIRQNGLDYVVINQKNSELKFDVIKVENEELLAMANEVLQTNDNDLSNIFEDVCLIKINKSYHSGMSEEELYNATSVSWVVNLDKTSTRDIQYYCAVYDNKIIEVYELTGYHADSAPSKEKRFILEGQLAYDKLRKQLIGVDVSDIHKGKENPIKYTNLDLLLSLKSDRPVQIQPEQIAEEMLVDDLNARDLIKHIHNFIGAKGFSYTEQNIKNLYLSLRSKPFVIISGISGTGKTKIVELFAESLGATEDNDQFKLIPVRPDWSDSSELLGYVDLKGDFKKGPLTKIVMNALDHPELPHFVLLDEMNLARVEYYFSDVLSIMESRKIIDNHLVSSALIEQTYKGGKVYLPGNLYVIGTVNMDETTYPFSKKVLDRANTIEFNQINLTNFNFINNVDQVESKHLHNNLLKSDFIHLKDAYDTNKELIEKVSRELEVVNTELEQINAHVGYRVRDEICFYMIYNDQSNLLSYEEAMDFCIMQKILPRITGSSSRVKTLLENFLELFKNYTKSKEKVNDMIERLNEDGFTSYWIS